MESTPSRPKRRALSVGYAWTMPTEKTEEGKGTYGVSVILPTLQLGGWLDEAISSVLDSRGVDLQLIVVHDGVDPDPSLSWMSDPRVEIVHQTTRQGLPAGIMSGVGRARFDLIGRIDNDDLMSPDRLAKQAAYLSAHRDTVSLGTRVMRIDESGRNLGELPIPAGSDVRAHLLFANIIAHSSLMFRKDACFLAGGFDENLHQMEDYDFHLRMACLGPIAVLDDVLTQYRVHGSQMSRGAKPYGPHIRRVMSGRRTLRKVLHSPRIASLAKSYAWLGAQYLRYYRVIKPGYERNRSPS